MAKDFRSNVEINGTLTTSGNVTASTGTNTLGVTTFKRVSGDPGIYIDSASGNYRLIWFTTNGFGRWSIYAGPGAESGSNAGSDFNISRYTDAGSYIDTPFAIARNTGSITLGNVNTGSFTATSGSIGANRIITTTDKISALASTTSSELLSKISDETGSGSLVFNTSPTLAGTVSAASVTLSGNLTASTGTTTLGTTTFYRSAGVDFAAETGSSASEGGQINLLGGSGYTGKPMQIDNFQGNLRVLYNNGSAVAMTIDQTTGSITINGSLTASTGITVLGTASTGNLTSSGSVSASYVLATSNGSGTNFKVGDDVWIGDINAADTMSIRGQQSSANGYIRFGSDSNSFGYNGSSLTYAGNLALGTNSVLINKAPYAFVTSSTTVGIPNTATITAIPMNTVQDDPSSMLSSGSVVVPKAGVYHIIGKWYNSSVTTAGYVDTFVYVNGTNVVSGFARSWVTASNQWASPLVDFYYRLSANASLTLHGRASVTSSTTAQSGVYSYIQVKWVSD